MSFKDFHFFALSFLLFSVEVFAQADVYRYRSGRNRLAEAIYLSPYALAGALILSYLVAKKHVRIKKKLKTISKSEEHWDEKFLALKISEIFLSAQEMWSNQDLEGLKTILHPDLYKIWEKKILNDIRYHRSNKVLHVEINEIQFLDLQNYLNDELDNFTVLIDFSCVNIMYEGDIQISKTTGEEIKFEYWTFEIENGIWILKSISKYDKKIFYYLLRRIKNQKKAA